ncbi:hypothetical protein A3C23_03945 [Candidatus Roizmanbacteria bacterium RIFCSPHIGHO2_02_FULL_37_13b]|nr:MAG: hypothetical protein A3C23_03945 [Candidatus Roizmanbacteria bacterium RIFCSPHIGHO2_02_FULL_37_13b]
MKFPTFPKKGKKPAATEPPTTPAPELPKAHVVKVFDVTSKMPSQLPANGIIEISLESNPRFDDGWDAFEPRLKSEVKDRSPGATYRRATISHGRSIRIVYDPPKGQQKYHGP